MPINGTGPASYFTLLCRGSHTMHFGIHPGDAQGSYNILGLFFNKGTHPAGLGLNPGEASWLDRGMSDNEPDILQEHVPAGVTFRPWMVDLRDPSKYWYFDVYNTNQGVLRVVNSHRF